MKDSVETKLTGASPEAQVEYLMKVVKLKDLEIADLRLQLKTKELEAAFDQAKVTRQLEVLGELNQRVALDAKAHGVRVPLEVLAWIEWKRLPWWKRIFRKWGKNV